MKTCLDQTGLQIVGGEIYRAIETLGGNPGLLVCIGSSGDTLDDTEILDLITTWNEMGEPFSPDISAG
jgi:hypothetical protein